MESRYIEHDVRKPFPAGFVGKSPISAGARLLFLLPVLLLFMAACVTTHTTPAAPAASNAPGVRSVAGAPTAPDDSLAPGAPRVPGAVNANNSNNAPGASITVPVSATKPPLPLPPPQAPQDLPTGSLWSNNSGSLFRDIKASRVGDILTITVSEEAKGAKTASTVTDRSKKFDGLFTFAGAGAGPNGTASPVGSVKFGPYEGKFGSSFDGNGSTTRTDSMSAYMTATVVDVLPNGNLVIRGSRWTKVNDEMQQIIVEGVIRPNDITRNNTVLSQNIADAKIFLVGKGPVAQHQKPGWLLQVLDLFSPF